VFAIMLRAGQRRRPLDGPSADTVEHLPPEGWSDVAMTSDLALLPSEIRPVLGTAVGQPL
jgi:hypothetical protein